MGIPCDMGVSTWDTCFPNQSASFETWLLNFQSSLLLVSVYHEGQIAMAQAPGSLPNIWESQIEFQATGFSLI